MHIDTNTTFTLSPPTTTVHCKLDASSFNPRYFYPKHSISLHHHTSQTVLGAPNTLKQRINYSILHTKSIDSYNLAEQISRKNQRNTESHRFSRKVYITNLAKPPIAITVAIFANTKLLLGNSYFINVPTLGFQKCCYLYFVNNVHKSRVGLLVGSSTFDPKGVGLNPGRAPRILQFEKK